MHLHSTLLFYFDVPYISATFFWKNDARETVYFSSSYVANSVFLFAELSPVDEKKERDIESSSLSRKLLQKSASTTALTLLIQPTGECHLYVGEIVQNVYLMHLLVFISMLKAWHFLIDSDGLIFFDMILFTLNMALIMFIFIYYNRNIFISKSSVSKALNFNLMQNHISLIASLILANI